MARNGRPLRPASFRRSSPLPTTARTALPTKRCATRRCAGWSVRSHRRFSLPPPSSSAGISSTTCRTTTMSSALRRTSGRTRASLHGSSRIAVLWLTSGQSSQTQTLRDKPMSSRRWPRSSPTLGARWIWLMPVDECSIPNLRRIASTPASVRRHRLDHRSAGGTTATGDHRRAATVGRAVQVARGPPGRDIPCPSPLAKFPIPIFSFPFPTASVMNPPYPRAADSLLFGRRPACTNLERRGAMTGPCQGWLNRVVGFPQPPSRGVNCAWLWSACPPPRLRSGSPAQRPSSFPSLPSVGFRRILQKSRYPSRPIPILYSGRRIMVMTGNVPMRLGWGERPRRDTNSTNPHEFAGKLRLPQS